MENITMTERGALAGRPWVCASAFDTAVPAKRGWFSVALAVSLIPTDNSTGVSVPGQRYRI